MKRPLLLSYGALVLVCLVSRHETKAFSALVAPKPTTTTTTFDDADNKAISFPSWSQYRDNYLKIHQRVNPRKAFGRMVEISRVLSGRVLFPLVCSLIKDSPTILASGKDGWDGFWTHKRGLWTNAERVALGLPSLGPSYVKLAQALATRPDILHVPLADALGNLHDSLTPFDDQTAKRIIRRECVSALSRRRKDGAASPYLQTEQELTEFLDSLSEQPVAAGSIAQVYKAHLPGCTCHMRHDCRPPATRCRPLFASHLV